MSNLLLENGTSDRIHRERLNQLLKNSQGVIRVASAYVSERGILLGSKKRERRLLVSLMPMDVISGATSLESIRALLDSGVKIRVLPEQPRFHAKVYIFGNEHAVVTSANLTLKGLDSNIEAGIQLKAGEVGRIIDWYDQLWECGTPLKKSRLVELQAQTAESKLAYAKLRRKFHKQSASGKTASKHPTKTQAKFSDSLIDLFDTAQRFFVCNTDRKQGGRTETGGFVLEQEMYNRGFATAWESFKYPTHMSEVEPGDGIFMYAKGVGIIGIGRALAGCETLGPHDAGRVSDDVEEKNTAEWRVPVKWLAWCDDAANAYRWNSQNCTFWNVSDSRYEEFRQEVKEHFLGLMQ